MRSGWRFAVSIAAAVCGAGAWMAYGSKGRNAQVFGRSVAAGPGRRRSVALTFDDGPGSGTREVTAYLAGQGVRATFFLCGLNVLRDPDVVRELVLGGHELGNHAFTHSRLCPRLGWRLNLRSAAAVEQEFMRAQEAIVAASGVTPVLMRAPYGLRWLGIGAAQRRLGLLGVHWTVIGHDWEWDGARVAEHVLRRIRPGAIICLHDGRDTRPEPDIRATMAALPILIPALRQSGFAFETVSEILQP